LTADSPNQISTLEDDKVRPDPHQTLPARCQPQRKAAVLMRTNRALTWDGPSLRTTQVYIVGGIVDHNRYKLLTLEKAEAQVRVDETCPVVACTAQRMKSLVRQGHVILVPVLRPSSNRTPHAFF